MSVITYPVNPKAILPTQEVFSGTGNSINSVEMARPSTGNGRQWGFMKGHSRWRRTTWKVCVLGIPCTTTFACVWCCARECQWPLKNGRNSHRSREPTVDCRLPRNQSLQVRLSLIQQSHTITSHVSLLGLKPMLGLKAETFISQSRLQNRVDMSASIGVATSAAS